MTDASPQFLDREAQDRVARLELVARTVVEGFLTGRHRSTIGGASLEFSQHREYVQGDDLRRVDWKVWARADRLHVKQYAAETNLQAMLLVDVSASMDYGEGEEQKYSFACKIAAVLAYALLRQSDAVGQICFDEVVRSETPPRSLRSQLQALLYALQRKRASARTDLSGLLMRLAVRPGPRGMMILVSDLLTDLDGTLRGLRALRQRGHDVVVLQVLHADELEFPFDGNARFEGMENADVLLCNSRLIREQYLRGLRAHLATLKRECAALRIDYRLTRTTDSLAALLARLFYERARK